MINKKKTDFYEGGLSKVNERTFCTVINRKITANTNAITQPAITCSELTTETLDKGVKYVQS